MFRQTPIRFILNGFSGPRPQALGLGSCQRKASSLVFAGKLKGVCLAAALCAGAAPAGATVLTFEEFAVGGQAHALENYADRAAGTENVVIDFGVSDDNVGGERLLNSSLYVWRNNSNVDNTTKFLTSPAGKGDWAWQGEAGFLATLTADPGYEVTIDSFDFLTTNRFDDGDVSALKIMDENGDVVWAQMFADAVQPNRAFTYTPGVSGESLTLVLQGPAGQGGYNLGLDNLAFSQSRANPGGGGAVPAPGGVAMLAVGAAVLTRRRKALRAGRVKRAPRRASSA